MPAFSTSKAVERAISNWLVIGYVLVGLTYSRNIVCDQDCNHYYTNTREGITIQKYASIVFSSFHKVSKIMSANIWRLRVAAMAYWPQIYLLTANPLHVLIRAICFKCLSVWAK